LEFETAWNVSLIRRKVFKDRIPSLICIKAGSARLFQPACMKIPGWSLPSVRPLFLIPLLMFVMSHPGRADDSATVKKLFAKPTRDYSTGPLWVWNDMLTEDQIRDTLRDLASQKVKQVWVHPRPGMMTPYLGKDWFRLWKVALKEAGLLDMNVWIYDENSYPSGFAGGWVPELMPESRGRGLDLKESKSAPKWDDKLLAVFRLDGDTSENVTARVRTGEVLPEARYLVASVLRAGDSPWHGGRSYVDLMYPGVTEKFLELTFKPYEREIGQHFGKRVPGIFTDEPNIHPAGGLPWTDGLPGEFQKRWGYSLLEHLPSLAQPVGDWRKIRHNYFQVLNEQFIEHWSKPYHDYCERHGLEWTGHYWDHEWPNCAGVPDNMAMYAWHQRPAIDCLMNQYREDTHAQFGNVRMVRELSSIANQTGAKRTLCEIYGAGGWDLRFEDMKRIGDWLQVLGVNTLNEHLSYVTLRGARKRDHPQSFSYHEPWWEAYHVSAGYLTRVSVALSQGEQINRVLVLEPTTTAWMYQGDGARLNPLGNSFFKLVMALESAQVEYDLGSEDVLTRHGSVAGRELKAGKRAYAVTVLPAFTENVNSRIAKLLEDLLAAGGTVVCLGEPPSRVDGTESPRMKEVAQQANWLTIQPGDAPQMLHKWSAPEQFSIVRAPGDKGILFHHRRTLDDGEVLFLVNTSIDAPSSGVVQSGARGVEKWDLYAGDVAAYPFENSGTGVRASFHLPPSGSLMLFLSKKPLKPAPPVAETATTIAATGPMSVHRVEPNVLTLDYVDITVAGETKTNIYFYQANQFAWQKNGMERNPWDSAVQFKEELISKTFPPGSGFEASYKFTIEGAPPRNLAIVIERPDLYRITCNGQSITAKKGDWWLDKAFGRIAIASAARPGENVVTIKATPFTMFHELEPAYVLGDFSLKSADRGFVIAPEQNLQPGQWKEQGQPFYANGVSYARKFNLINLTKPQGRHIVALGAWRGSVAKVLVNGKSAGYITAPPWQCDVTPALKSGGNTIEVVVIGTLKNTLGPHHGNPPLGSAWPGMFQRGAKDGQPPGSQYSTVGYGLFEPFVLTELR
jgi:hypothetical protein